ncbi:hypothetical protein NNC19_02520 [Clostridium sp. SHJSY1]|uniref:hypothetical protein n=1 Tax=Clostridium sp. SHJSY1 TaxID=2942483 RepID=UPI002874E332|nr:hypothetical protein [Clostridium sp. SHJSY1]MDS0524535.1 hypothetical protein [Clostridium sp. SHJSY1]
MLKISSKYLNVEGLQTLIESSKNTSEFDGALIITSLGMIVGKLVPLYSETEVPHAAELVYDYKEEYVSSNKDIEIIGDGSLIVMEEVTIIYGNNTKVDIEEITIHCTDIIGFSPINIEKFKSSLN